MSINKQNPRRDRKTAFRAQEVSFSGSEKQSWLNSTMQLKFWNKTAEAISSVFTQTTLRVRAGRGAFLRGGFVSLGRAQYLYCAGRPSARTTFFLLGRFISSPVDPHSLPATLPELETIINSRSRHPSPPPRQGPNLAAWWRARTRTHLAPEPVGPERQEIVSWWQIVCRSQRLRIMKL